MTLRSITTNILLSPAIWIYWILISFFLISDFSVFFVVSFIFVFVFFSTLCLTI